jgi:hypothetical protein
MLGCGEAKLLARLSAARYPGFETQPGGNSSLSNIDESSSELYFDPSEDLLQNYAQAA